MSTRCQYKIANVKCRRPAVAMYNAIPMCNTCLQERRKYEVSAKESYQ